jgi:hypothetical protein
MLLVMQPKLLFGEATLLVVLLKTNALFCVPTMLILLKSVRV